MGKGRQKSEEQAVADASNQAIQHEFGAGAVTGEYRPVTIVDTSAKKRLELTIEVPVEDMAKIGQARGDSERAGVARARPQLDLDRHPSAPARTGAVAPVDADIRE